MAHMSVEARPADREHSGEAKPGNDAKQDLHGSVPSEIREPQPACHTGMTPSAVLVLHLQETASAAIANDQPALEHPRGHVGGLTVQRVLTSQGHGSVAGAYVERRTQGGALLGRHVKSGPIGKGGGDELALALGGSSAAA
jgi:hypothetical protein